MNGAPTAVVVHLSGSRRGQTQRLQGKRLRLGTSSEAEIGFDAADGEVAAEHAVLQECSGTYELQVPPGNAVWVNGEATRSKTLRTGDVLEVGEHGPVVRFRLYPADSRSYKTVGEAFRDCVDCTRYARSPLERASILLMGLPMELATQTSLLLRGATLVLLVSLTATVAILAVRGERLADRFESQRLQVGGVAELVRALEQDRVTLDDLGALRGELRAEIDSRNVDAVGRIESLESQAGAVSRVIGRASGSIVFLQGSYGFADRESGELLRFQLGGDGRPLVGPGGEPIVVLGGQGPVVERQYTGSAFVASPTGLLLTNRHVALPWEYDDASRAIMAGTLTPKMIRLAGFLPGVNEPFAVELVTASDTADLAVLRCSGITTETRWLELQELPPEPGDEVIVMGYPTGLRALLARSDTRLLERLMKEERLDFWSLAQRLSELGRIGPLATRGIVSQVAPSAVVYDAETTGGGSGGPVLDLDGKVVAINTAIIPEFGGSNLGVPALQARRLLAKASEASSAAR